MPSQTKTVSRPEKTARMSLRTTLFFEAFLLLAITVVVTTVSAFFITRFELTHRAESALQSAAQSRTSLLETTINREREQLSILARDPSLARLPAVTNLVGFRALYRLDGLGEVVRIAGQDGMNPDETIWKESITSDRTIFRPIFSEHGWMAYAISTPQMNAANQRIGTFVAVFNPEDLMTQMFRSEMSDSTEVLLAANYGDGLTVLHSDDLDGAVPVRTASTPQGELILRALAGEQGTAETIDYAGIPVLAAYRTIPSLGWTVVVQMDRYEITKPILQLAMDLLGIGLMLVGLLSMSMYFLASRITAPLEELKIKLDGLETKHWKFRRSVFTGNELEVVDIAAADLTSRLRRVYDHLEDIVKERTQQLTAKNAQSAAILENVEYGLVMTDPEGRIVFMNRSSELLTGFSMTTSIGENIAHIMQIANKEGTVLVSRAHPVHLVLETRERFSPRADPEFSLLRSDGARTALHLRVTPILRGKKCLGAVAVFRDTTEERRIDRMKSEFITLVSHQLRTPLSSMRWYLEMLLEADTGSLNAAQHEYVEEVATSNARMVHLVNALLNVSRLELGKMQMNPETVDTGKLLTEISDSFKLELQRRRMKLDISAQAPVSVRTDRGLLQLIIENLISNAVKYGREGTSVEIVVQTNPKTERAEFTIWDHGIGIPENQQAQIFQKMFRGTNARSSDTDGNGLGLYISRIAAESIGATLEFKSDEGKGTLFTVTVPVANGDKKAKA